MQYKKNYIFKPKRLAALISLNLSLAIPLAIANAQDVQVDDQTNLEKITVTAQKRSQNLQEVPVSVTALSGEAMAESAIKDIFDIQTNVPGLVAFQSQSSTNSSFSIRGVGTSSQNFGLESSVGLYVDGVFRARQNSLINNLVDMEAVEVLRGPQGTLFGKNTPSGAILVKTKAPVHDRANAFVEATVGNYGLLNFSGATNITAVEDILSFRLTGFTSSRDGTVDEVSNNAHAKDDLLNNRDRWGTRAQALYTPTDDLSIRIIADYAEIDEICCGAPVFLNNRSAIVDPTRLGTDFILQEFFGATRFEGGDEFFNRDVALNQLPFATMEDSGLSVELNWDLDDNYSIVSVTALRDFKSSDVIDSDFTDAAIISTTNIGVQTSFSQELRLDNVGEELNFIVGAYYFQQDLNLDYELRAEAQFEPFYNLAVLPAVRATVIDAQGTTLGAVLDQITGGIDGLSAATGGAFAPSATPGASNFGFPHRAEQEHESYALFGQMDYKFNDKFTLTAGLRYTEEEKILFSQFGEVNQQGQQVPQADFTQLALVGLSLQNIGVAFATGQAPEASDLARVAPFQNAGWGLPFIGATTSPRPDIDETLNDDQITGTLKLSYQPDNDTLMYASFGTGYKSGGTNTDRIDSQFNPVFDAETSTSYELGLKKDFPEQDFRLNAALHLTDVEDFQANTFTGNGFNLQNAGDIQSSGAEVELTWIPTDALEIGVTYAYIKAEFDVFERGNCYVAAPFQLNLDDPGRVNPTDQFCDRGGDRIGGQPEHYALLKATYEFDIFENVYSYIQSEYSYTSDFVTDGSNDPLHFNGSYNLLNLRLFMSFEDYDTDLIFWGRNVLDEEYINGTTFNVPVQNGKINGYLPEPATFGVTVKKRF